MIADKVADSSRENLEGGGADLPPLLKRRVRGRSVERLARLEWIAQYIAGSFRAVNVHDLQDVVGNRFDVSARQVRDDLMLFRGPKGKEKGFVFWKRAGVQLVWTNEKRYERAVRGADGSLEAYNDA